MSACLRCGGEADGLFCLSCELAVRDGEDGLMAALVPAPGAHWAVRHSGGHLAWRGSDGWNGVFWGLCHCPLGEAHYAEVSR